MKNTTAPRTLAECQFTTGYPVAQDRPIDWQDKLVIYAGLFALGFVVGIVLSH